MNYLRECKKTLSIFFSSVLFFSITATSMLSCSEEHNSSVEGNNLDSTEIINKVYHTMDVVANHIPKGMTPAAKYESGFTQEMVDEYAALLGYEPGEISLERVENVMQAHADVVEGGYQDILDSLNLSNFTKLRVEEIMEGSWIEDMQNSPGYSLIADDEKELLQTMNTFAKGVSELPEAEQAKFLEDGGAYGAFMVGALAGAAVGGIGGFVLGGLIGCGIAILAGGDK